jgi:hypothetical protein
MEIERTPLMQISDPVPAIDSSTILSATYQFADPAGPLIALSFNRRCGSRSVTCLRSIFWHSAVRSLCRIIKLVGECSMAIV